MKKLSPFVMWTLLLLAAHPTPAQSGNIQGVQALKVTVVSPDGQLLSGEGCELHYLERDGSKEILKPCGDWFLLPNPGWYRFWAQYSSEDRRFISSFQPVMYFAGAPFNEKSSESTIPVSRASRTRSPRQLEPGESFRVAIETESQNLFTRSSSFHSWILIPSGIGIAGIFDEAGNAKALTPSFKIDPDEDVHARVRQPKGDRGHVLVIAGSKASSETSKPKFVLEGKNGRYLPDVVLKSKANMMIAVWYDIPKGKLLIRNRSFPEFRGESIEIRDGRVTTVRRQLVFEN